MFAEQIKSVHFRFDYKSS